MGDKGKHGSVVVTITEGSPTHFANNRAVARLGDKVACPQHGVTTIVSGVATTTFADNKPVAIIGCKTACGATIEEGSTDTFAE